MTMLVKLTEKFTLNQGGVMHMKLMICDNAVDQQLFNDVIVDEV